MKKKRFRSLELVAKNCINTFFSGTHISEFKDHLMDVDTVRDYQPGDKKLDSKSSIKSGKVMSRVFNPERSMNVFVILDFSSSQITKFDAALTCGLYFSYLADMLYDGIGLLTFSDKILNFIEPTDDQRLVVSALEDLYNDEIKVGEDTDFALALAKVRSMTLKNTLFVLISDFCCELSEKELRIIKQMSTGESNSFISVILFNEQEWLFENCNFELDFYDLETDRYLRWDSKNNHQHLSTFESWKRGIRLRLRQARVEPIFTEVNDERFLMPIVRYISRG